MTRDIFDTLVGTLDIIIHAVLVSVGTMPARFSVMQDGPTLDQIAADNALLFVEHFAGYPIRAIKAIRDTSGLSLKDSKDAWEQILETYELKQRHLELTVVHHIRAGNFDSATYYIRLLEQEWEG